MDKVTSYYDATKKYVRVKPLNDINNVKKYGKSFIEVIEINDNSLSEDEFGSKKTEINKDHTTTIHTDNRPKKVPVSSKYKVWKKAIENNTIDLTNTIFIDDEPEKLELFSKEKARNKAMEVDTDIIDITEVLNTDNMIDCNGHGNSKKVSSNQIIPFHNDVKILSPIAFDPNHPANLIIISDDSDEENTPHHQSNNNLMYFKSTKERNGIIINPQKRAYRSPLGNRKKISTNQYQLHNTQHSNNMKNATILQPHKSLSSSTPKNNRWSRPFTKDGWIGKTCTMDKATSSRAAMKENAPVMPVNYINKIIKYCKSFTNNKPKKVQVSSKSYKKKAPKKAIENNTIDLTISDDNDEENIQQSNNDIIYFKSTNELDGIIMNSRKRAYRCPQGNRKKMATNQSQLLNTLSNVTNTTILQPHKSSKSSTPKKNRRLRPVIIDGLNIGHCHGLGKFSVKGIELCIKYFVDRGHKNVIAFIPQHRKGNDGSESQKVFSALLRKGHLCLTPSRQIKNKRLTCYDDRIMLQYANRCGGVVVSNDNFRDLYKESNAFKEIIEYRHVMVTFVRDVIIVPDDQYNGKHDDISLSDILRFPN